MSEKRKISAKCDLCGKEFNITFRKKVICLLCKKIFCLECRPFEQSPICNEHFRTISESNKKNFMVSYLNILNRMTIIRLVSLLFTLIGGFFLIVVLNIVSGGLEIYLIFIYSFNVSFVMLIVFLISFKIQRAKTLKLLVKSLKENSINE